MIDVVSSLNDLDCIHFKNQNPRRDDVNKIGKCLYQSTSFNTEQIFTFIPSLKPQEL